MDALFVRLFAYSADMVSRIEGVHDERVKALEVQVEELTVTSLQLRAAAEVAAQALTATLPGIVLHWCVCSTTKVVLSA